MKTKNDKKLREHFAKHGVKVLSKKELDEIRSNPEVDEAEFGAPKMGRPAKGSKREATIGKTVKHTEAFWKAIEREAKKRGMSVHEAMRDALAKWLKAA